MDQEVWLRNPNIIETGRLRNLIEEVYSQVAEELKITYESDFEGIYGVPPKADKIFFKEFCKRLNEALIDKLGRFGIEAREVKYRPTNKNETPHAFAVFEENEVLWAVDLTWQQFLPKKRKPDVQYPKALVAKAADIELALTELGIPPKRMKIWTIPLKNLSAEPKT